ncbi:hypothetical protein L6164_006091 [Bauhinia variegata]|uniref:Uncharacterized protein n=1 Tax=Bauhinia variegata TaxID=167791 RepID=A0ACB9PV65_BAUVA|nr:hypothetical protein L6164_006091 [Bauhinia variegata]
MRVPKSLILLLLSTVLLSILQGSCSTSRLVNLNNHVDTEGRSSMFMRSYSAIFSSLNSGKHKMKQIHAVSHRLVPSGPNRLHN